MPAARFETRERTAHGRPTSAAAMTSGTVLMPTTSTPIPRNIRISAGVSYDGPSMAASTPVFSGRPISAAAACSNARRSGS